MSAETTPAVERAAEALKAATGVTYPWALDVAPRMLAAALDVEEMAWAMCTSAHCSGSKRTCPNYSVNVERATKLRAAILGTTS